MTTLIKSDAVCSRCVMDGSAQDIVFDSEGVCNYCRNFLEKSSNVLFPDEEVRPQKKDEFIEKIKADGVGKRYDCIVGLSGGVDSSWVLHLALQSGLRPLAVHMDNGWDSELAHNNIHNLVEKLNVDLYTHVIDWHEYRSLMQGFFDADVIDVELLYDNAMLAVNYTQADKYGVKYILSGHNTATEGMPIPKNWNWFKFDKKNIYEINRRFCADNKIKSFPAIGTIEYVWYEYVRKVKWLHFLDYFNYNKSDALNVLQNEYDYKPYQYKHYESVFTRFYQGYILPKKFGVDKRRLHLSTLIVAGQMAREDAVMQLEHIPYPSEKDLNDDIRYFLKKMGWTQKQLEEYLLRKEKPHALYGTELPRWNFMSNVYNLFK